jgi:hypothetical protein
MMVENMSVMPIIFMLGNNSEYANAEFWLFFECRNTQFVSGVQMVGSC